MSNFNMEDLYPGKFDEKLFEELSERANEHQLTMERLYGDSSAKLLADCEEKWEAQRKEFLDCTSGVVASGKDMCEAMQAFGEAADQAAIVFVVNAAMLAQHPELTDIAKQYGGELITSERMPEPEDKLVFGVRGGGKSGLIAEMLKAEHEKGLFGVLPAPKRHAAPWPTPRRKRGHRHHRK